MIAIVVVIVIVIVDVHVDDALVATTGAAVPVLAAATAAAPLGDVASAGQGCGDGGDEEAGEESLHSSG